MKTDAPKPLSAADLRAHMAEMEEERLRALMAKKARAEKQMDNFLDSFLHQHLSEEDTERARLAVRHAAEKGQFEALIMRFPSEALNDGGRALNNNLGGWEETLTGKARELHALWEERAKPAGYGLKAMILDFPGGIPGDVGLFLTWAPPVKI